MCIRDRTQSALHRSYLAFSSTWWFCVLRVFFVVFFPKVNVVIWRLGFLTSKVLFFQRRNGKFRFIQFRKAFYWSKWVERVRLCSGRYVKELGFIGHREVSKWIRPVLRNNRITFAKRKCWGLNIEIGTFVTILQLFHSTRPEQIYSRLVKHATKNFVGNDMKLSEFFVKLTVALQTLNLANCKWSWIKVQLAFLIVKNFNGFVVTCLLRSTWT